MFYSITIGVNPYIVSSSLVTVSWHGFFTFVAVVAAMVLVTRWGRDEGISSDDVQSVAIWAIIAGIVGARVVHVVDRWDVYGGNVAQIV